MMNFLRKQMKWVMAIIVVAFLLSTFLMYEGRSTRRAPAINADGSMSDYEVAQINGRSLMRSELEQRLRGYLSTLGASSTASLDMPAVYQTVLNQAVLESQLLKEIDEQGIKISDAEAEQAMKNYADTYYPTRETFYQALAQSGIKIEDYKRNLARQIAVDRLMNNAIGEIEISEDKAVEFYDSLKKLFYTKPEGFLIHMADFNTSADAEAFRARLTAGESWDVIASEDKVQSSDIINITKNPIFLPASALRTGILAVLASTDILEPSEVFAVSSSDFGVGMKTSRVEESTSPYDEVSEDIRTLLTQEEQRKRLAEYEETLRTKANLVINDTELFARPVVSEDEKTEPEFMIEEISKDTAISEEPAVEVKEETKAEEIISEEPVKVEEVKEEVKTEETKSEDVTAVEAEKTETEEVKPEEKTSEEPVKVEEVKEEVKENAPAVVEEAVKEAAPEAPAVEEAKPEAENLIEEVKEAVTEIKESKDIPLQEEVKEN